MNFRSQQAQRLTLPSGKSIDVLVFDNGAELAPSSGSAAAKGAAPTLAHCPQCSSALVHPTAMRPLDNESWALELECPNCNWEGGGVYGRDAVEQLDDALDEGGAALLRDLRQLTCANLEDEIIRLAAALEAGAIQPMDF